MPAISIIIPVYNVAAYLDDCLQSVLRQTFSDLEILCVNDGATDASPRILEKWAAQDKRIKIISQPNQGLGAARNTGLNAASGNYILFLDSDDFLDLQACEKLYKAAQENDLDAACCDFYEYNNNTAQAVPRSRALELPCKHDLNSAEGDTPNEFVKFAFSLPFAWGKLFRRDIIEQYALRFPKGAVEDVPFTVAFMSRCQRVKMLDNQYLFYYRVGRSGNLSAQNEKMLLDGLKNLSVLEENLKNYGIWENVKETFWFNKMVLLIGDEKLFAGRLGNVPPQTVEKAYDYIRTQITALDISLFNRRNALFRWKVRQLCRAVKENDLKFPRRLRKLRNILMLVLDPYYKLISHK